MADPIASGARSSGGPENSVARRFVAARLGARALADFPGQIPRDLATAYAHQNEAIALWPSPIAGWKIGRIAPELAQRLGAERLAGPIFRDGVRWAVAGEVTAFPVFEGGFAAVEAEYVIELDVDVAPAVRTRRPSELVALVRELRAGIETAGSPLATINALGPTVVVSDFGNNHGLIVGPPIRDWRRRGFDDMACETFIQGTRVGQGGAASLPGGPLGALSFFLDLAAQRGLALRAGDLVSTGATTGIHEVCAGEGASVVFDADLVLEARAEPAHARS